MRWIFHLQNLRNEVLKLKKNHINQESLGQRIWYLRNKFGISQEELANISGTTVSMIKKYEKDIITQIPYAEIEKMADVLHTSAPYLLYGKAGLFQENPVAEHMSDENTLLAEFMDIDLKEIELLLDLNDKTQKELDIMVASGMFNQHIEGYLVLAMRSIGYPESEINSARMKLRKEILGHIPAESVRKTGEIIGLSINHSSATPTDDKIIYFPFRKKETP